MSIKKIKDKRVTLRVASEDLEKLKSLGLSAQKFFDLMLGGEGAALCKTCDHFGKDVDSFPCNTCKHNHVNYFEQTKKK